jgi:hypothetical protein
MCDKFKFKQNLKTNDGAPFIGPEISIKGIISKTFLWECPFNHDGSLSMKALLPIRFASIADPDHLASSPFWHDQDPYPDVATGI